MIGKRKIVLLGVLIMLMVIAAWFSGGERPTKTIVQPVDVPAAAQ